MKTLIVFLTGAVIATAITAPVSWWLTSTRLSSAGQLSLPFSSPAPSPRPLDAYSIPALAARTYQPSEISIIRELVSTPEYTSYLFSYRTLDRTMTGQLNLPTTRSADKPPMAIVMMRGYVPPESYTTGTGTKNAAAALAKAGFITVAPDFFSYGESDPEPEDTWQGRFEKPAAMAELIATLEQSPLVINNETIPISTIGIWAHSNGGQIALTTLEILAKSYPTTLWAPVTAPFPYSVLFFSDENADEGKATRAWIALFERTYDVFNYSLTQHLDRLQGPLQLHHGSADDAALKAWSDEFIDKIEAENDRRGELAETIKNATDSTQVATAAAAITLEPIEITYFEYPGADHNLRPSWDTVVARDIEFFTLHWQ